MGNCLVTKLKAVVDNPNLPRYGFCSTTKSLFNTLGITVDLGDNMQKAVDNFIFTLVNAGLWGNTKINALCLPFLTNLSDNPNLDDAVINCINTEQKFFQSGYADKLSLLRNGLVPKRTGQTLQVIPAKTENWATKSDIHFAYYSLEDEPIEYTSSAQQVIADKAVIRPFPITAMFSNCQMFFTGSNRSYGDANYANKSCFFIGAYNPDYNENKAILYVNGQSALSASSYTPEDADFADWFFGKYQPPYLNTGEYPSDTNPSTAGSNGQVAAPVGLISAGKYLTGEEVVIYNNAANELIAAVHAYME